MMAHNAGNFSLFQTVYSLPCLTSLLTKQVQQVQRERQFQLYLHFFINRKHFLHFLLN